MIILKVTKNQRFTFTLDDNHWGSNIFSTKRVQQNQRQNNKKRPFETIKYVKK